jgi:ankyrin repeat protein
MCEGVNDLIKLYINSVVKYENKLDYKDDKGNTALIVAIQTKNEDIANTLINAGADVTIQNNDGKTAFFYAIRNNMPDI